MQKIDGYGPLLDIQMSFRVAGARDCAPCQKWAKREGFVAISTTLHYTTLHFTTLQLQLQLQLYTNYTTLHYNIYIYIYNYNYNYNYNSTTTTTLHYTTLH